MQQDTKQQKRKLDSFIPDHYTACADSIFRMVYNPCKHM